MKGFDGNGDVTNTSTSRRNVTYELLFSKLCSTVLENNAQILSIIFSFLSLRKSQFSCMLHLLFNSSNKFLESFVDLNRGRLRGKTAEELKANS